MRADESISAREKQLKVLRGYLQELPLGARIPIEDWYEAMKGLGLEHSARQRLSDLKKLGLSIPFIKKHYHYQGWPSPEYIQQDLPLSL